jgi:hypothetical protein
MRKSNQNSGFGFNKKAVDPMTQLKQNKDAEEAKVKQKESQNSDHIEPDLRVENEIEPVEEYW